MEYLIAFVAVLLVVCAIAGLVVLVIKLTTSTVGPAEHQRGFDAAKALMAPQVKAAELTSQRLWNENRQLGNRLEIAERKHLALPANTVTVPPGHSVTVRAVQEKKV